MLCRNSVGISHPPMRRFTILSPYTAIVLPCCSYTPQNGTARTHTATMARTRGRFSRTCSAKDIRFPVAWLFSFSRSGGRCFWPAR